VIANHFGQLQYVLCALSAQALAAAAAAAAAGFNAVRVPMNFTNLQRDIPKPKNDGTEFYACMVRQDDGIQRHVLAPYGGAIASQLPIPLVFSFMLGAPPFSAPPPT
jgi:hypothetical protein